VPPGLCLCMLTCWLHCWLDILLSISIFIIMNNSNTNTTKNVSINYIINIIDIKYRRYISIYRYRLAISHRARARASLITNYRRFYKINLLYLIINTNRRYSNSIHISCSQAVCVCNK